MLTVAENELLTRVGPGTPAGRLFRRYWQPVALTEELPSGGRPVPIRLLGEDLVLFKDKRDRIGLIGTRCPHRGADLSYGRIEPDGLRCPYHGWLYDVDGRCLDQPVEPLESSFKDKIRHTAYPCREVGGLIFTYMGPGEPPLFPHYACWDVPEKQRFVTKMFHECNYLQGLEGSVDPSHLGFLHRMAPWVNPPEEDTGTLELTRQSALFARDSRPHITAEETEFGLHIYAVRAIAEGQQYVRVTNFVYPHLAVINGGPEGMLTGYTINWHTPVDDYNQCEFNITYDPTEPLDKYDLDSDRRNELTPDFRFKRGLHNRFLQSAEEMESETYLGVGTSFSVHDHWAGVAQGPITDRTVEHMGTSDAAIIAARRAILNAIKAVEAGQDPPHVIRDPSANSFPDMGAFTDIIPSSEPKESVWERLVRG